jgi:hypothetical protein
VIVMFLVSLASATDVTSEAPAYALDRNQLEALLRSLNRPVTRQEIDETHERQRFFRPPHAATLLRNSVFVKETDELWREVFGRSPTSAELFNVGRSPNVVASRRYVKWLLAREKPSPDLSFVCIVKDLKIAPVANALLIETSAGVIRRTDAVGRALIERPDNGERCNVHLAIDGGYHNLFDELTRRENVVPPEFVLRRLDGPAATGTVRDTGGRPLPNALVTLQYFFRDDSPLNRRLYAVTDAEGRYSVKWLHPDAYAMSVTASRPGYRRESRTFHGQLKGLSVEELASELRLRPSQRVSGRVLDEEARPIAAAIVRFRGDAETYTDSDGRFSLNENIWIAKDVGATIVVERRGYVRAWRKIHAPGEITFTLAKGAIIRGKVVDAKGKPLVGVRVRNPRPRSFLGLADDSETPNSSTADVTDERGAFELGPFEPKKPYEFTVSGSGAVQEFGGVAGGDEVLCRLAKAK